MQAIQFLHTAFAQALPGVHARRLAALMACVSALLSGRHLTLTALGRGLPGTAYPKHAIKRVDRLLGNAHLHSERLLFYAAMLRALLGSLKHPLILVDWSPVNAQASLFLLRAAIPLAGRSFPIYECVHDRDSCPRQQNRLLDALECLLPEGCVPTLVTDAGFRRPWFQAVEARGWHYVGRVRHRDLYRTPNGDWAPITQLHQQADATPRALGQVEMTRRAPHRVCLYCVRQAPKGRKHRRVTGRIARSKHSRQNARREREPWLLASNLPNVTARTVVGIYRQRMQIEEGFRDVKSLRFGFALDLHRTRCPRRIEVLLLIAALGGYVLHLAGLHARDSGEARRYQSNTVRTKAVLSVWRVGLEYLRRHAGALPRHVLIATERLLCDEVHRQAQGLG